MSQQTLAKGRNENAFIEGRPTADMKAKKKKIAFMLVGRSVSWSVGWSVGQTDMKGKIAITNTISITLYQLYCNLYCTLYCTGTVGWPT